MKRLILVFLTVVLLSLTGCKSVPASSSNGIVGVWKDAYGLTEYQFHSDGTMEIRALNFSPFQGTYRIEGSKVTLHYRIVLKDVKDIYTFKIDGNTLYLNNQPLKRKNRNI